MDGWGMDRWMGGWMGEWMMGGWIDGRMNGRICVWECKQMDGEGMNLAGSKL